MTGTNRIIRCPTCKKAYEWDENSPWRPFCSERCKMIDLGEWLSEGYRIPDNASATPFGSPDDSEH